MGCISVDSLTGQNIFHIFLSFESFKKLFAPVALEHKVLHEIQKWPHQERNFIVTKAGHSTRTIKQNHSLNLLWQRSCKSETREASDGISGQHPRSIFCFCIVSCVHGVDKVVQEFGKEFNGILHIRSFIRSSKANQVYRIDAISCFFECWYIVSKMIYIGLNEKGKNVRVLSDRWSCF